MDQSLLQRAREKFDEASVFADELAAKSKLRKPRHFFSEINVREIERLWSAFLVAYNTAFDRLISAAGQGSAWSGIVIRERKSDELLAYLHHARNVDLHGLKPITVRHEGSTRVAGLKNPEGDEKVGRILLDIVDPHIQLIDVQDRGAIYPVPKSFRGANIAQAHPVNISLLGLSRLAERLTEAEAFKA